MFTRTSYALVAASIMPLVGPRPLFVRTAYAEARTAVEEVVMPGTDAGTDDLLQSIIPAGQPVRIDQLSNETANDPKDV